MNLTVIVDLLNNFCIFICMKWIIFILLIFFAPYLLVSSTNSVTNVEIYKVPEKGKELKSVAKYLKERKEKQIKEKNKKKQESPVRRFEIEFFSSTAILYLSTFSILKLYQMLLAGSSSSLPDVQWYYIGFNSIGIATYIAVKDYYDNREYYNNKVEKGNNNYKFSFLKVRF